MPASQPLIEAAGHMLSPPEVLSPLTSDFSLVLGGPIHQFFVRAGLVKQPLRLTALTVFISLLAWLPLLVLTILDGRFLSGVKIPFLYDFDVHIRLLIVVPALIAGELVVRPRMRSLLLQFIDRQIITPAVLPKFESILKSALRLRNSVAAELTLAATVVLAGTFFWKDLMALRSGTWYSSQTGGGLALTPAGHWYQLVGIPITQFLMLRWYFRLFLWARLLWQVSKLELNLIPSHPDRACGLGFLGGIVFALGPFLMAHSALFAANFTDRIVYGGAQLKDFAAELVALAAFLALLALGPLCVFGRRLHHERSRGVRTYGRLASEYVLAFERKWIDGKEASTEPLLGSPDIQSLADLSNSFSVVKSIQRFPFGREAILTLMAVTVIPWLPLIFTLFSIEELAIRLLRVLLG